MEHIKNRRISGGFLCLNIDKRNDRFALRCVPQYVILSGAARGGAVEESVLF